jgi:hypothetical protein
MGRTASPSKKPKAPRKAATSRPRKPRGLTLPADGGVKRYWCTPNMKAKLWQYLPLWIEKKSKSDTRATFLHDRCTEYFETFTDDDFGNPWTNDTRTKREGVSSIALFFVLFYYLLWRTATRELVH